MLAVRIVALDLAAVTFRDQSGGKPSKGYWKATARGSRTVVQTSTRLQLGIAQREANAGTVSESLGVGTSDDG